jgi:hypothetical protein
VGALLRIEFLVLLVQAKRTKKKKIFFTGAVATKNLCETPIQLIKKSHSQPPLFLATSQLPIDMMTAKKPELESVIFTRG